MLSFSAPLPIGPSTKKTTHTSDCSGCAAAIVAHCFASASESDVRRSHDASSSGSTRPRQKSPPPETTNTFEPASMWSAMNAACASAAVYTMPGGTSSVCSRYGAWCSFCRTASPLLAPVLDRYTTGRCVVRSHSWNRMAPGMSAPGRYMVPSMSTRNPSISEVVGS